MVEFKAEFVGLSGSQQKLLDEAGIVAPLDTTVLLTGESGTGKELLAHYIHRHSPRREGPFVICDCAALPATLCEGELFGYRRGAFTGAQADSLGYLASSHGGTIFLDEIAELGAGSQTKLLRFLEERTVTPLGEVRPRQLDARIVAATNRDLDELVSAGRFREDLYFRLNVVNLTVNPLRDRPEDIEPLCEHFRRLFAVKHGKRVVGFTPQALAALLAWRWPGNVRELRNAVERAAVLCRGTWIDRADLPEKIARGEGTAVSLRRPVAAGEPAREAAPDSDGTFESLTLEFQRSLLSNALAAAGGDRRDAARRLGLTSHQFKYLMSSRLGGAARPQASRQ